MNTSPQSRSPQSKSVQPPLHSALRREADDAMRQRLFSRVLVSLYFLLVLVMIYGVRLP
ncbi:hypothetical protein [Parasphingorhabdus sp.]|uniref:hypothetical protein n=1 Tax=Parasphingorhabdus sp. TaxID=2709688 RepID=UPI00326310A7